MQVSTNASEVCARRVNPLAKSPSPVPRPFFPLRRAPTGSHCALVWLLAERAEKRSAKKKAKENAAKLAANEWIDIDGMWAAIVTEGRGHREGPHYGRRCAHFVRAAHRVCSCVVRACVSGTKS